MFVFLCLNKHNTWLDICMLLFFILDLNMKVITTSLTWKPILERLWKKRLGGRISCPEMKASVPLLSLFCKTAPFPMKKWPYKRGVLSWRGQFSSILPSQCIWNLACLREEGDVCGSCLIRWVLMYNICDSTNSSMI